MSNLYCIKHPDYRGTVSPNLHCRTCCGIYVAAIKKEVSDAKPDAPNALAKAELWLNQKADAAANSKSSRL